jgi:hypothetical protein
MMKYLPVRVFYCLLALPILVASDAWANLISNGSFETPMMVPIDIGSTNDVYFAGDNTITGWEIGGNSVDLTTIEFFHMLGKNPANLAYEGKQFIDLEGTPGPGSIAQTVSTEIGALYLLSFAYSRNINMPELYAPNPSTALVTISGSSELLNHIISSDLSGQDLLWTQVTLAFFANSATVTLSFASNDGRPYYNGILIDDVSIAKATTVPEPNIIALIAAAFAGMVTIRSRKPN